MIIEICVIIATLIFAITAIFVIRFLRAAEKSLAQLDHRLISVEAKLIPLVDKSEILIGSVNERLNDLTPLFQTTFKVGHALNDIASSLERQREFFRSDVDNHPFWKDNLVDLFEIVGLGVSMYKQFKKRS